MLFDSHAHYDDAKFDADRFELIASLPEQGVGMVMNACSSMDDIGAICDLCKRFDFIYGAAGVHPSETGGLCEEDMQTIKKVCTNPKIKAVGEIGLDYFYDDDVPHELQKKWFARQIELAHEVDLPIIVHDRDAHRDTLDILRACNAEKCGGVVHCFSGSCETAREVLDLGFYIAFGGVLTFKNARRAVESAVYVPIDRILLETDAPYLAPVPHRGERNNSALMRYTAEKLAEIKGMTVSEVEDITLKNAKNCYRIEG